MPTPVYLDYNATTPIAPAVVDAMLPYLRDHFGNPSSGHVYGVRASRAVQSARAEVAALLGAAPESVLFTGCATEANNLAIRGVARALRDRGRHLITSAVEHPSVAMPCRRLVQDGWELTVLPVDGFGRVAVEDLERALRPDTVLVSVMHANNEVGTMQPVAQLAAIAHARGVLLHTDAAQSAGKVPVEAGPLGADLITLAGHKFHAPKGVGALYLRAGLPLAPLLVGGGQERGLRPGTESVAQIVAMGAAARLAGERLSQAPSRLRRRRDALHRALTAEIPGLALNGHPEERLPNTLNLSFPEVSGAELLELAAEDVAASVGSACHTEDQAPSGVLGSMGLPPERARGAVRLSVGMMTTDEEVSRAAARLAESHRRLARPTG